jgi:ribosome-binding factor A
MKYRTDRLAALIKEEISLIFLYKLKDPVMGLVTITEVKMSPDLKYAKIYISVYEKDKRQIVLEKVNLVKGMIRAELASKIKNIRAIPELSFFVDDTIDYVEKIEDLLKKVHENDNNETEQQ